MTELAMSDANPPARVSLLTLVSFRGVGIIWETPGQFRVSSRLERNPEVIQPRSRRFPAMPLVRRQRIWQLRPKKACYFGRPYPLT